MPNKRLTVKRSRFVEFYDGNGVKACKQAGFKGNDNVLAATASRLLRNVNIQAAIAKKEKKRIEKGIMGVEEIQQFWTDTIKRGVNDDCDYKDLLKAAHDLTKSHGGFIDRKETDVNVNLSVLRKDLEDANERLLRGRD